MIEIFDADCGCLGIAVGAKNPVTTADLRAVLDRLCISRALVRYEPLELSEAWNRRNEALFALAATEPHVRPCPALVPASGLDAPAEDAQVDALIARGAAAATVAPLLDSWLVEPFVCDRLFGALEERRLPLLAPVTALSLDQIAALAGRFPALPFIVVGVGYRSARDVNALLDARANVYLSLGHNYTIQGVVEQLTARYGADRFVLGTGFPAYDPNGAVTQLMYARIDEQDQRRIGHGTLDRLVAEVKR